MHDLWRAVDQEGEVLESFASKTRDKAATPKFRSVHAAVPSRLDRHHHVISRETDKVQIAAAPAMRKSLAA